MSNLICFSKKFTKIKRHIRETRRQAAESNVLFLQGIMNDNRIFTETKINIEIAENYVETLYHLYVKMVSSHHNEFATMLEDYLEQSRIFMKGLPNIESSKVIDNVYKQLFILKHFNLLTKDEKVEFIKALEQN